MVRAARALYETDYPRPVTSENWIRPLAWDQLPPLTRAHYEERASLVIIKACDVIEMAEAHWGAWSERYDFKVPYARIPLEMRDIHQSAMLRVRDFLLRDNAAVPA